MDENLWSYLHDGTLAAFEGSPPGRVRITVEIPHLRRLWADHGYAIYVTLYECDELRWDSYDTPEHDTTPDMDVVEVAAPAILQVQRVGDKLVLNTESGDLIMAYGFAELELDTGVRITIDDLRDKSEAYWNRPQ